jgi:hypothetical protein
MNLEMSLAAVSMRTALKYRRDWNKNGPAVKLLQSLMPQGGKKKGYRLYLEPGKQMKMRFTVPPAVRVAVQKAGYIITDYLAKKCVKASDKEQKNVFNIGKVIAKDVHAKTAFDNDPQLQNSKATGGDPHKSGIQVVVSCHPYDIIGMSTGRNWDNQSCMRLKDFREGYDNGQYNKHVKNDVAEGTLVVYAIRADDTNIQKPLCRCLVKPFVNEDGDVLYRRETRVYGNPVPGFSQTLNTFLRKINAHVPEGFYEVVSGLYNDGAGTSHHHRVNDSETSEITQDDVAEDPSLIVPYVKQRMDEGADESGAIIANIARFADTLHDEDIKALTEMMKGSPKLAEEYANQISMGKLNPVVAQIGRAAGFLEDFGNKDRLSAYKEFPPSLHGRFAQSGLPVLREYVLRMEQEHNVSRMRELVAGLMDGTYPLPDENTFVDCPRVKSWIYTMASAARYMPLFGVKDFEKQVHDLVALLEGTEKTINADIVEEGMHVGPSTVGLALCLLLDNDDSYLESDAVFAIPVEEAAPVVCKRRPFKAMERLKNNSTRFFMDHIKLLAFQQCMQNAANQDMYKDIKQAIIDYMEAEPENFDSTRWTHWNIKMLAHFHLPLLKYVNRNVPSVANNLSDMVPFIADKLNEWKGDPIDPDENDFIELVLRLCVATGRLLDPPMTLSHKVALEDMDNDAFYEWYNENKEHDFPPLGKLFGHVVFGTDENARKVEMLSILPLLVDAANASGMEEDTLAFSRFSMKEVARSNRQIIRTIKSLPMLGTAITQFENYCESLEVEETQDEDEAARELVYTEEMGVALNPDDDNYDEQYAEVLDEAKKIIEDRNYAKVDLNSKIVRVAEEILSMIGYDDDSQLADLRQFFDNFPEDELEDYEDNLANSGQNIADLLRGLIENAEEYRNTAGYN